MSKPHFLNFYARGRAWFEADERALNKILMTQSTLRVIDRAFNCSKRGVPWAEVLSHAHNHGGQI